MIGGPTWLATHVVLTPQALPSPTTDSRCSSPKCSARQRWRKNGRAPSLGGRLHIHSFLQHCLANTESHTGPRMDWPARRSCYWPSSHNGGYTGSHLAAFLLACSTTTLHKAEDHARTAATVGKVMFWFSDKLEQIGLTFSMKGLLLNPRRLFRETQSVWMKMGTGSTIWRGQLEKYK